MAPVKFGLFKARSRDYQEQPSTENLLHNSSSSDTVASPMSPLPTTSHATAEELALIEMQTLKIHQDGYEATTQKPTPTRRPSLGSSGDSQIIYQQLRDQTSTAATSTSTLQEADLDRIMSCEDLEPELRGLDFDDGASTSCDANSLQFDDISIAPSEDISVHCGALPKKPKKSRSREEQQLRDYDMWHASNIEVMQNILNRSGTVDEQLKWEAIATARGLCTLTECCTCGDCHHSKYLAGIADGDAGIATAPLISAINGCSVM